MLVAGHGRPLAMLSAAASLLSRLAPSEAISRRDAARAALVAIFHLAALLVMAETEIGIVPKTIFLFTWGLLNFFWLAVLRRPAVAAALSLALILALIQLSLFKHDKLLMTVNFVDVMILDPDTIAFFLTIYPDLLRKVVMTALVAVPILALVWWLDPFRVRLRVAAAGSSLCLVGAALFSIAAPMQPHEAFFSDSYVSKFVNSGVDAILTIVTHGYMESDAAIADNFQFAIAGSCQPAVKPPHIILILDEFEFRHHRCAGNKGSCRLRPALPLVRRQDAVICRRRRGRSDLVFRIQRLDRPVRALLRALRLFRHPHRSRPRRPRTAACVEPVRLPDFYALSGPGRVHECARLPEDHRHRAISRRQRHGRAWRRARLVFL